MITRDVHVNVLMKPFLELDMNKFLLEPHEEELTYLPETEVIRKSHAV